MLDIEFRQFKTTFIEPRLARLARLASLFHPITITVMSLVAGIAALVASYFDYRLLAVLLWLACRVFDGLDGMVARISGKQSDLGGYLDLVVDFLLYAALPLVIAFRSGETIYFAAAAILLGVFYLNATIWMIGSALFEKRKMRGAAKQTSVIMPRGLMEGFETMIFNCLMLGFPAYFVPLALVMAGLTLFGGLLRFVQTLVYLAKESYNAE